LNCNQWPYPCDGGFYFVPPAVAILLTLVFIAGLILSVFALDESKLTPRRREVALQIAMVMVFGPAIVDMAACLLR
jgi:hypothetical protein